MKVGILGNGRRGIGSRLLAALSHGGRWLAGDQRKGVAVHPLYSKWNTHTDAPRYWHNPADPVQAARIEAAAAKRGRKADKLTYWALCARINSAIKNHSDVNSIAKINPFYIAK